MDVGNKYNKQSIPCARGKYLDSLYLNTNWMLHTLVYKFLFCGGLYMYLIYKMETKQVEEPFHN